MKKLLLRQEKIIIDKLTEAGYEAYFVGGCVRDALHTEKDETCPGGHMQQTDIARISADTDVATSALPHQVKQVFSAWKTVDTGLQHGTVTVILPPDAGAGAAYSAASAGRFPPVTAEVTTYRSDGDYSDGRHPDRVEFLASIEEDLARRDFTINAMACDGSGRIIDPFGGQEDLQKKCIRAVGDADSRFREDALRIMRALRFASVLGFRIEEETERALFHNRYLLKQISAERIFAEFKKLVSGKDAGTVLRRYIDVLGAVMPELSAMKGFEQHNPYHRYDVLEHCIRAMEAVETTEENRVYMKLAALFHDIGKPQVFSMDEKGIGHFYGHPAKSEEIVREVLKRMKADRFITERTAVLVKRHDLLFERDEALLKKWMNRLTPEVLFEILELKRADNFATGNMSAALSGKFQEIGELMASILAQEQCFSLKDLAVSGNDLLALGMEPGPAVGAVLDALLEAVIEDCCENERTALLALARGLAEK